LAYKIQAPGITQKKEYNVKNTAKVWDQEPSLVSAKRWALYMKTDVRFIAVGDKNLP
jgi:hypothetical protein